MKKTVVIGLDGATWKLLKPFAEKGWMPTVKRILENGVHGNLESTIPAMTAPSWVTFATGKHPGKHGVFDFMLPTDTLENMQFATSKDIKDKTVYELFYENDIQPILINLPGSFPPKIKDVITITDLLTQGDEWIFPRELKDEFPELKSYRLTPNESVRIKERREEYIEELLVHMDEQLAAVKRIFKEKPWGFFFYLFSHTDWVSHLAYTELEEQHDASAKRVFEAVDRYLAWFVENLPKDANLILVSDHGFKAYKKVFYFNRWLEKEGYLKINSKGDQFRGAATRRAKEEDKFYSTKKKINLGSGVFKTLSAFPPAEKAARWAYHNVIKPYLPLHIKVNVGIDFDHTKVCFPKGSYVTNAYINKAWVYKNGIVTKEEYLPLRTEVVEKMKQIKDPEGRPVVARVFTREEVYGDHAPENAPDIFFELSDYWLLGQFQSANLFGKDIENKHDNMGIFMAMGPDFGKQQTVDGLKMQDITPLLLHLNGLAVPSDCDGRVPTEIFATDSAVAKQPVQSGPPSARQKTAQQTEREKLSQALRKIKI